MQTELFSFLRLLSLTGTATFIPYPSKSLSNFSSIALSYLPAPPFPLHLQSPFLLIILVFTSGSGSIDFKGIKKRKKISSNNVNFLNLYSLKRNKIGKKGNDIKWLPLVIWVSFDSFPNYCHCNKLAQINIKQTCVITSKTRSDL